jgi:hypothetical protein
LTAIRSVYGGLLLTPTPAALWGGTLVRLAQFVCGDKPAPANLVALAAEHADPDSGFSPTGAAELALAFLQTGDAKHLQVLGPAFSARSLAPWLTDLWVGVRAALSCPLDRATWPLFAVACPSCAGQNRALLVDIGTYDEAIRCPHRDLVPAHPLPGVRIGEPHPVGRCVGGLRGRRTTCMVHDAELDAEGLCVEGRALMDRAVVEVAAMMSKVAPFERTLVDAVVRAQRIAKDARTEAEMAAFAERLHKAMGLDAGTPEGAADLNGTLDRILTVVESELGALVDVALASLGGKKRKRKKAAKPKALRRKGAP